MERGGLGGGAAPNLSYPEVVAPRFMGGGGRGEGGRFRNFTKSTLGGRVGRTKTYQQPQAQYFYDGDKKCKW